MTLVNVFILFAALLIFYDVGLHNQIGWPYYIGYVLSTGSLHGTLMLSVTLLSKICTPEVRATMFGISGMFGSVGILVL